MIDPKLNDIPVNRSTTATENEELEPAATRQAEATRRGRSGLSINDTIAGDTNLSVGSRGVDTSGVSAGSGAGAGMSFSTPGPGDGSPAPNVVSGARGTGTTPRADGSSDQASTLALDHEEIRSEQIYQNDDEIAMRAYECWHERGCPEGSPEIDWHRAADEVRQRRSGRVATAGGSI